MSFRESSVFQGHFIKGMTRCLQTGIFCIYADPNRLNVHDGTVLEPCNLN